MSDFSEVPDQPMDQALGTNSQTNQPISLTDIGQRNIDTRSGNFIVRDASNSRIVIGILPDGNYGMVISKPGFNVEDLFT